MAEKAADLIMENTPLAPEALEFYRHASVGAGRAAVRSARRRPA
jgi:hypothetical protein